MSNFSSFQNQALEGRVFSVRLLWAIILVISLTALLIARLVYLQVLSYEEFANRSDKNRVQFEPIPPTRGLITDRNGELLAENQPAFSLDIIKEQVADMDATLHEIQQLIQLSDDQIQRFYKRLKQRSRPLENITIRYRLNETEIAKIAANQHRMAGVSINARLLRSYPKGADFAHVLGYVHRINDKDLAQMIDPGAYAGTQHIGRVGLEYAYETQLHGKVGLQKVETNARGQILGTVDRQDPQPGENLQLYLDAAVQQAAADALGSRRGAVVAIELETNGVLAFVSKPAYNPNLFVTGISQQQYDNYRLSPDQPLFNRVIQGQYPPGSTIKPLVGLAGIENKAVSWGYRIEDPGFYQLKNDKHKYRDWKKGGHGNRVNLHQAIVQSCDTYFYDLSFRLGIDQMHDFLDQFSLGRTTGIDLVGERTGILPSKQWKKTQRGRRWYHGETLINGIGQGYMLATPMQLAVATATLAKKGQQVIPRLVQNDTLEPAPTITLNQPKNWDKMFAAMRDVIHSPKGTAQRLGRSSPYQMAGKTGTAQVISIAQDASYDEDELAERHKDHALFIAFAPVDDPKIAIAVIVENGSHGGSTAGPIAKATMDAYLLPRRGS